MSLQNEPQQIFKLRSNRSVYAHQHRGPGLHTYYIVIQATCMRTTCEWRYKVTAEIIVSMLQGTY